MKQLVLLAATFGLAALVACEPVPASNHVEAPSIPMRNAGTARSFDGVQTFTDPATGCEYLTIYGNGITPRFEAGGNNSSGAGLTRVRGCR